MPRFYLLAFVSVIILWTKRKIQQWVFLLTANWSRDGSATSKHTQQFEWGEREISACAILERSFWQDVISENLTHFETNTLIWHVLVVLHWFNVWLSMCVLFLLFYRWLIQLFKHDLIFMFWHKDFLKVFISDILFRSLRSVFCVC